MCLRADVEERRNTLAQFGLSVNLPKMKSDLERYKIHYDNWFYESSLHDSGYVAETAEQLSAAGWTYEKEGALWLKTADIMRENLRKAGKSEKEIEKLDLKDDVLRRANGFYTYFAADIAYHRNKLAVRGTFLFNSNLPVGFEYSKSAMAVTQDSSISEMQETCLLYTSVMS